MTRSPHDAPPLPDNVRHLRPADPPAGEPALGDVPGRDLAVPPPDDIAVRPDRRPAGRGHEAAVRWHEPAPAAPLPRILMVVVIRTRNAATHERTRIVVRHATYIPVGAMVVGRRLWEAKTNSRYERMMRAAESQGNWEKLEEWEARAEQARERRHRRRMSFGEGIVQSVKGIAVATGASMVILIVLGVVIAVADHNVREIGTPLMGVIHLIRDLVWLIEVAWGPVVLASPAMAAGYLWHVGRTSGTGPAWLAPPNSSEAAAITPARVVIALRDLGIPALRKAVEQAGDGAAMMLSPIRIAGCGSEVDVTLPSGVSTAEVQGRRRKLAENLDRHEHELHMTIPAQARTVRLWVADSGALDEPIGPSPLVTDDTLLADLHSGRAPWGQDLRGDPVALSLWQRHLLITGVSNQGKTAAMRALLLWAILDRSTEVRVADLKGVGDWRMFDGIASVLIQGPSDEHVMAATHMLEQGVAEMEDRLVALEESGATDGITREMSRKPGSNFHPIILVVDEAQQAFMCPAVGPDRRPYGGTKATSRFFMAARKIHNQGRAVNVVLWEGTQDPTDQNLPKLVREGAHIRASLAVGTQSQAEMALGEKAVNAGAAPHELRQGLDRGTLVVSGDGVALPPGQASLTVRTHFISGEDAAAIAERAKRIRGAVDTASGEQPDRDHLADIAVVMRGERRVRTEVIRQRLAELDSVVYEGWTAQQLTAVLAEAEIEIRKSNGFSVVREEDLHRAISDREQAS